MASSARLARASHGLTDDVLTLLPRARTVRAYLRQGADQLAGADPGLTQLRLAIEAVLSIGVGVGLAYVFVQLTGALRLPASAGTTAAVHTADHALMIVALLIICDRRDDGRFRVTDTTARGQIISTLLLPIPMLATMTIGIALGPYRLVSLIWLVSCSPRASTCVDGGPAGTRSAWSCSTAGSSASSCTPRSAWTTPAGSPRCSLIGVIASLLVRFTLFRPNRIAHLDRMRRSWEARAGRLLRSALP